MTRAWLLRRLAYLTLLAAAPVSVAVVLIHAWDRVVAFLNGTWPPAVSNVANVLQVSGAIAALAWALTRIARSRAAAPSEGAATRVLRLLALLLPLRNRERFVREVAANLSDRQRWWQRIAQLLSVAAAVPGLAVILRRARRRA